MVLKIPNMVKQESNYGAGAGTAPASMMEAGGTYTHRRGSAVSPGADSSSIVQFHAMKQSVTKLCSMELDSCQFIDFQN